MTPSREEALGVVRQLPEEVDIEELIYRLYLLEKLAAAEADITARRTIPAGEVWERVCQWQS
jgi:hypothetical protein